MLVATIQHNELYAKYSKTQFHNWAALSIAHP